MSCLAGLLANASRSIETELQPRLQGLFGGIVRALLPQTWVFRSEREVVSLVVDPSGRATVVPGASPSPDVTVEGPHDALRDVLSGARGRAAPPSSVRVTPVTSKGRTAFDYLRGRFGM
ncbi:MAG TPA: hypothetical protein VMH49_03350 [Thermoplasmata archaeon]|nr:hypothetical protein [Thermoplasmata archaeon]